MEPVGRASAFDQNLWLRLIDLPKQNIGFGLHLTDQKALYEEPLTLGVPTGNAIGIAGIFS